MKKKILVVLGPTATGKSALALHLAQKLGGEIISGDSMLVYKGFDIGTAKPSGDELKLVNHHLIDILDANEKYSAAAFQKAASDIIEKLSDENILPIIAGGTGLYIKALLEGYKFPDTFEQPDIRRELEERYDRDGSEALYSILVQKAPDIAKDIHPNNKKRLVRALELLQSGDMVSRQKQTELIYDAKVIGLMAERPVLYDRINQRVDMMFEKGLVTEVEKLLAEDVNAMSPPMQAIGYKEVVNYLNGEYGLEECKRLVKQNTRHFAKRQITWYKKMSYIDWYDVSGESGMKKIYHDLPMQLVNR